METKPWTWIDRAFVGFYVTLFGILAVGMSKGCIADDTKARERLAAAGMTPAEIACAMDKSPTKLACVLLKCQSLKPQEQEQ